MYVRIPLPRITPGTATNLLGVAGLVAIVVSIGMLAGLAWAVMAAGICAVLLTVIAQVQATAPAQKPAGQLVKLAEAKAG